MKKFEKLFCEAIGTYLQDKEQLGVPSPPDDKKEEDSHCFQFLHEQINDLFATKAADLVHYDGACAAFRKVHNYKYVNDPTFEPAIKKEFSAQAIPESEQKKALEFITKIIEEVGTDKDAWSEQDSGWNPSLDEVMDTSRNFNESIKESDRTRRGSLRPSADDESPDGEECYRCDGHGCKACGNSGKADKSAGRAKSTEPESYDFDN